MHIRTYDVEPNLPEALSFLEVLSHNLWWCWNRDAQEIFYRIDTTKWKNCGKNPLAFLDSIEQERMNELAEDDAFLSQLNKLEERYNDEVKVAGGNSEPDTDRNTAYFCLEYGIHESIRIYSGGLGVLAGDHLKAASDQNASFTAVGLLYRQGYFQQYLSQDGQQQEHYPENPVHELPLFEARDKNDQKIVVSVPLPDGQVEAAVWVAWAGNIPLYLLDTNIPQNKPEFRTITARLYAGDKQIRLRQEILLAVGGFRALIALGYEPSVCHMNEGHAAFLSLARIEHLMKHKQLPYAEALEIVRRSNVFTTHTPVPAGNEWFDAELVRTYLDALAREMDIDPDEVLSWGMPYNDKSKEICNTILALRMSHFCNGVSKLHGEVARDMWKHLWKERPKDEVPIGSITNAVHAATWVGEDYQQLFNRYLGPSWRKVPHEVADSVAKIPEEELWRTHEFARIRMIQSARNRMERQYRARNCTESELERAKNVLQDDVLTIGFARRFATYKRATLLLKDPERLRALLTDEERPIQFIFAGKAHPADQGGKDLIKQIIKFTREADVGLRIIFLEDYDIGLARQMVQGVDVWLNTPMRPMEASGTSGMKSCLNGGLHVSILDGWWAEAYSPELGWAIGNGSDFEDTEHQDLVESHALFNLLEKDIIPLFYERSRSGIPLQWIEKSKASIAHALRNYTCCRMYTEYYENYYKPADEAYRLLTANSAAEAQRLVKERSRFDQNWKSVELAAPEVDREDISILKTGDKFTVRVQVNLGEIKPEEVDVQIFYGPLDSYQQVYKSNSKSMDLEGEVEQGRYSYAQELVCEKTGRHGFTCRVIPRGNEWKNDMPGFVTWV